MRMQISDRTALYQALKEKPPETERFQVVSIDLIGFEATPHNADVSALAAYWQGCSG